MPAPHPPLLSPLSGSGAGTRIAGSQSDRGGPDNIAFGQTGKLYVALAFTNQVGVLDPSLTGEVARYAGPAKGANVAVPWSAPAGVAFNNATGSLLVTNHALVAGLVDPKLFVVFDVYVNDRAVPLERPGLPSGARGLRGSESSRRSGPPGGRGSGGSRLSL